MNDVVKLALIDQQWKASRFYYGTVWVTYCVGYFCTFYMAMYFEGQMGRVSAMVALLTSWLFVGLSAKALK